MSGERVAERRKAHGRDVLRHKGAHLPHIPVRGLLAEEVHEVGVEAVRCQLACSALQIQALHQEHIFRFTESRLVCSGRERGGG